MRCKGGGRGEGARKPGEEGRGKREGRGDEDKGREGETKRRGRTVMRRQSLLCGYEVDPYSHCRVSRGESREI